MSTHPDDDFNLKAVLESELSDVVPDDGLAKAIIARHRAGRRRRVAGAVGLVMVLAGIGVPLGLDQAHGVSGVPGNTVPPGHVLLHLGPYTLQLPGQYHLTAAAASAPCGPGKSAADPGAMAAAVASGACLVMLLTSPFTSGTRGARPYRETRGQSRSGITTGG